MKKSQLSLLIAALIGATLFGCQLTDTGSVASKKSVNSDSMFANTQSVIPFDDKLRRKWGAAVVSDLDQNGWEDVITTQHGANALIYWNDKGTFSEPVVLIKGDTHGLGVSDYNSDGKIDIIVAQGGGDGGNPRRPVYFSVNKDRTIERLGTFDHFRPGRGRGIKFIDSDQDADLDVFVTGYAPKNVKSLTTNQLYQNVNGALEHPITLAIPHDALSMKALTTDVNNDGKTDVIVYGGGDLTLSLGKGDGTYTDATASVFGALANVKQVSSITEIDYDNDGDFDLLFTRAPLQFEEEAYYDPEQKNLAFFAFRDKFMFDNLKTEGDNLILENIQETWATYDIQLGKSRKVVEAERSEHYTEGRLVVKPEQAMGWPDGEKLKGLHIGYLGNSTWRVGGYVKSRLAAVIKNVVSQPKEIKRKPMAPYLLENQNGQFVDVTQKMGIMMKAQTMHAAAGDFNNDGFMDLAVTPYGNMAHPVKHLVYMNQAGNGFKKVENAGLDSIEVGATGVGITTIDYDQDGRLDLIYGNERGRWYLAENQLSGESLGQYIVVNVGPSAKNNAQPIGARVDVEACGKKLSQLVGASGEGYHHMLKARLHFGLGACHLVDRIKVTWPNGDMQNLTNLASGQTVNF
ncbi:CRTAC1 family protein [Gayadomonas joobiniege]|uniref:CRTAC1 family protein n=1 Tax=Gayadomonas joobiniege TaxID=1234606 RepID=UPI000371A657|nr:CRTAC1 family protein [Gayadomonas joobiniege]